MFKEADHWERAEQLHSGDGSRQWVWSFGVVAISRIKFSTCESSGKEIPQVPPLRGHSALGAMWWHVTGQHWSLKQSTCWYSWHGTSKEGSCEDLLIIGGWGLKGLVWKGYSFLYVWVCNYLIFQNKQKCFNFHYLLCSWNILFNFT